MEAAVFDGSDWLQLNAAAVSHGADCQALLVRGIYERIPWPSQIRAYHDGLVQYYMVSGGGVEEADREFGSFLDQRYIEATDRNSQNNVQRGALLYSANEWVVITLVLMALAALPFTVAERSRPEMVYKVEVLSPGRTDMTDEQNGGTGATESTVSVPPQKPIPPANIEVKTGATPKEKK